jgi:hypothetical protein
MAHRMTRESQWSYDQPQLKSLVLNCINHGRSLRNDGRVDSAERLVLKVLSSFDLIWI